MTGDKVTAFPDPAERTWLPIRTQLRAQFKRLGVADAVLDASLDAVRAIYLPLRNAPSPRGGMMVPTPGLQTYAQWVQQFAYGLLTEILEREIEMRQAGLRN